MVKSLDSVSRSGKFATANWQIEIRIQAAADPMVYTMSFFLLYGLKDTTRTMWKTKTTELHVTSMTSEGPNKEMIPLRMS